MIFVVRLDNLPLPNYLSHRVSWLNNHDAYDNWRLKLLWFVKRNKRFHCRYIGKTHFQTFYLGQWNKKHFAKIIYIYWYLSIFITYHDVRLDPDLFASFILISNRLFYFTVNYCITLWIIINVAVSNTALCTHITFD